MVNACQFERINLKISNFVQCPLRYENKIIKWKNKMELLQSQAPVDRELSGSSASAKHGTLDIGHQTWDIEIWKY